MDGEVGAHVEWNCYYSVLEHVFEKAIDELLLLTAVRWRRESYWIPVPSELEMCCNNV